MIGVAHWKESADFRKACDLAEPLSVAITSKKKQTTNERCDPYDSPAICSCWHLSRSSSSGWIQTPRIIGVEGLPE
jgi:hypothetical protein